VSTAHPLHTHCHRLALAPVGHVTRPRERHFCHDVITQEMTLRELEHQANLRVTSAHHKSNMRVRLAAKQQCREN
jgi:hypothetical protein